MNTKNMGDAFSNGTVATVKGLGGAVGKGASMTGHGFVHAFTHHHGNFMHAFGVGHTAGSAARKEDFKWRSKAPGLLLDVFNGKKWLRKLRKSPAFKRWDNKFRKTSKKKGYNTSFIGLETKHFRKTGKVIDPAAKKAHERAKREGLTGWQAMTTGKVSKATLKKLKAAKSANQTKMKAPNDNINRTYLHQQNNQNRQASEPEMAAGGPQR